MENDRRVWLCMWERKYQNQLLSSFGRIEQEIICRIHHEPVGTLMMFLTRTTEKHEETLHRNFLLLWTHLTQRSSCCIVNMLTSENDCRAFCLLNLRFQRLLKMNKETRTGSWTSWWTWESVWTTRTCLMVRCVEETDTIHCKYRSMFFTWRVSFVQGWSLSLLRWESILSKPVGSFASSTACWPTCTMGKSSCLLFVSICWQCSPSLTAVTLIPHELDADTMYWSLWALNFTCYIV